MPKSTKREQWSSKNLMTSSPTLQQGNEYDDKYVSVSTHMKIYYDRGREGIEDFSNGI